MVGHVLGCIPSKMMIRAAETLAEVRRVHQLVGAIGLELARRQHR